MEGTSSAWVRHPRPLVPGYLEVQTDEIVGRRPHVKIGPMVMARSWLSMSGLLAVLVSTLACVGSHPLEQGCPCASGWVCDTAHQICVRRDAPGGIAGGAAGAVVVDTSYPDACPKTFNLSNAPAGMLVSGCPCTRRPGPGNSAECPQGGNASTSAVIGPQGGTIMLIGQQGLSSGVAFTLDIPPGALSTSTLLTLTETDLSPPSDFVDFSPVYRIGPLGVTFSKPVALRVPSGGGFVGGMGTGSVRAAAVFETQQTACSLGRLADSYENAGVFQASIAYTGYIFVGSLKTADLAACP